MTLWPTNAEPLFDPPLPDPEAQAIGSMHTGAGDTEQRAAKLIWPRAGKTRRLCLDAFIAAGDRGLTDRELADKTGLYLYTAAPRRGELVRGRWVEDSGDRREGMGTCTAIVWTLTAYAKHRLATDTD